MASETPGGRGRKRPIDHGAVRSTDEYYRSGEKSVVSGNRVAADRPAKRTGRHVDRTTVRSADEYYANPKDVPKRAPARVLAEAVPQQAALVTRADHIEALLGDLAEQPPAGPVVVSVTKDLVNRLRVALDLAVTRRQISEDSRVLVRLQVVAPAKREPIPLPPIDPSMLRNTFPAAVPAPPVMMDPAKFLAAGGDEHTDPKISTAPLPVTEVEVPAESEDSDLEPEAAPKDQT